MADQSKPVRRMSRDDAMAEATRLAAVFLASQQDERWHYRIAHCAPCTFDPKPIGKTPSRWFVGTACTPRDTPDAVIDGADPTIIVDLLAGTASWYDTQS
jgi:hypothetical protein